MFEPLVKVLRRVDGDVPAMGYIFDDLMDAKREVQMRLDDDEGKYKKVFEIIDKRWDDKLKAPLHLTGFYLNPFYYYENRFDIERETMFRKGVVSCVERMYDLETTEKILDELPLYTQSQGLFERPVAKSTMLTKNFSPAQWWLNHGCDAPYLRDMAVRILSLTCSSSGCERNWCTFEQVHGKRRCTLLHARMNDLVFVKFNSKLVQKKNDKNPDPVEVRYVDILEGDDNEWVHNIDQEVEEGMNADAVASSSKKGGTTSSGASFSGSAKKKKKLIQVGVDEDMSASSDEGSR